jgi:hypothetical protein
MVDEPCRTRRNSVPSAKMVIDEAGEEEDENDGSDGQGTRP